MKKLEKSDQLSLVLNFMISIDNKPSADKLIARAESLAPKFFERAIETEQRRCVSSETINELFEAGLLRYYQPECYGGYELDWGTHYRIGKAIAQGCPSTAWITTVVGAHSCYVARMSKEAQDEVWANATDVLIATGSVQKTGTVVREKAGFRVNGSWGFASGVDHAAWGMVAGRMDGEKEVSQYLIPRRDFCIDDVWYVAGMKGTGTKDINVKNAFVPAHRAIRLSVFHGANPPGAALHTHYLYRTEFRPFSGSSLLGPIIGTAEAAFDHYVMKTRGHRGAIFGDKVSENPSVQSRVSESAAELAAANALAEKQYKLLNLRGKALEMFSIEEKTSFVRDRAFIMKLCLKSTERLVRMMGANGLFDTNPVQRCFRDLHAMATQFGVNWDLNMPPYGAYILGVEAS